MFMSAPFLALVTAFCIGTADFSTHYPLRHVKALPGAFFGLCFQMVTALLILLAIGGQWGISDWRGPVYFFLAGILHPGAFYVLLLLSLDRVGPARAITLKGTSPLWGVAIAMIFLGERPNLSIYLGLFLVAFGVMYLSSEKGGRVSLSRNLAWPLIAAFFSGLAPNLAKTALRYIDSPFLGVVFAVAGGLATLLVSNTLMSGRHEGKFWMWAYPWKRVVLFAPLGVLAGVGFMTYYSALKVGTVAVVIPLVQTAPFFAIVLSRLLIQRHEGVNVRLVASAAAVVLGAFLITTGRG